MKGKGDEGEGEGERKEGKVGNGVREERIEGGPEEKGWEEGREGGWTPLQFLRRGCAPVLHSTK